VIRFSILAALIHRLEDQKQEAGTFVIVLHWPILLRTSILSSSHNVTLLILLLRFLHSYQSAGLITFFAWLWVQDFTMLSELRTPTILNLGVTAFSHVLFVVGILLIQVVPLEVSQSQVDFMSVTNVLGSPMVWVASLWAVFACIAPVELAKLCGTCLERNAEDVEGVNTMIAGFERAHAVGMLNPLDEALMDGDSLTRASMSTDGDDESRDSVFTAWSNRFSFVGTKAKGLLSPGRTTPSTDADKLDGFAPPEEGVQMRSMQSKGERISMAYDES
jgi:hypothetical protein